MIYELAFDRIIHNKMTVLMIDNDDMMIVKPMMI